MHWINLMSVASKIKSPFAWFDFKYIIRLPSFTLHWPDVYMSWYAGNKCNFDSHICLKSWIKIEHSSLNPKRYGQKGPDTVCTPDNESSNVNIMRLRDFLVGNLHFPEKFSKTPNWPEWYKPSTSDRNKIWSMWHGPHLITCSVSISFGPYTFSIWCGPCDLAHIIWTRCDGPCQAKLSTFN